MSDSVPTLSPAESRFRGWKIVIPLFLLPLLIVAGSVGVFYLFGRLAQDRKTPEETLEEMMRVTGHRRWQLALELSRSVILQSPETLDPTFENRLIEVYRSSKPDEAQLRTYLTVALANIGHTASATLFVEALSRSTDSQEQIYSLWALGKLKDPAGATAIRPYLTSEDPGLRKAAAFSLGFTGGRQDLPSLEHLLEDPIQDVQWNAALALANLGSDRGSSQIRSMLDLPALTQATPTLRTDERHEIVISALNAALKLKLKGLDRELADLSNAPDARVRTLAQRTQEELRAPGFNTKHGVASP